MGHDIFKLKLKTYQIFSGFKTTSTEILASKKKTDFKLLFDSGFAECLEMICEIFNLFALTIFSSLTY